MVSVDLGPRSVRVPVAEITGSSPGKTLLITAGVDGDEYAGVEAAYQLIERFASRDFSGKLIVIPIVNIPGYETECSLNPLDGRFPKSVFPGDKNGQPTQRLVHWLISTYASQADVWLDLHGGANTERIHPFLWTFETGVESIDQFTRTFHEAVSADVIVFEKASSASKAGALARNGCAYLLAESGDRVRTKEDVTRHIEWTTKIMELMEMLPGAKKSSRSTSHTLIREVTCLMAPHNGRWSVGDIKEQVKKGELLGTHTKIDASSETPLRATKEGIVLWYKETTSMRKGDVLCAIGRS